MNIAYLDNNATTKVAPEVAREIYPFLDEYYANPSSTYSFGKQVGKSLGQARERIAGALDAEPEEIVFTSCGTEADNAAINAALNAQPDKDHIVTTQVEHPAVLNYCLQLESKGYKISFLGVDPQGNLDIEQLKASLTQDTAIVSIMYANNETGVLFPLPEIAEVVKEKGILLHTDAVQAVGKIPISLSKLPVDYLALSGHKIHAPKGVGALFVRKSAPFSPLIVGGEQENGRRGGTENTALIAGLGKAMESALNDLHEVRLYIRNLRDSLENSLLASVSDAKINGDTENRLPNTSSISFRDVIGEQALLKMDEHNLCASAGAACKSGSTEPSRVLKAMQVPREYALGTLRFSLSRFTTRREIDLLVEKLPGIVQELRKSQNSCTNS